jgi:hypothetical protein
MTLCHTKRGPAKGCLTALAQLRTTGTARYVREDQLMKPKAKKSLQFTLFWLTSL